LSTPEGKDIVEIHEKIEILSTDDEKLKLIGSLLNNDTSRNILKLLFEQEMAANEIAEKTGILLSLVIFHLQKMQQSGIVSIKKIEKNSKGHNMKYYGTSTFAIVILPSKFSEKAKKSKSLLNSLTRISKFAAIGISGLISWTVIQLQYLGKDPSHGGAIPQSEITPNTLSIIIPLVVMLFGLVIERIVTEIKK
jgi:predicted transcriptional regulator